MQKYLQGITKKVVMSIRRLFITEKGNNNGHKPSPVFPSSTIQLDPAVLSLHRRIEARTGLHEVVRLPVVPVLPIRRTGMRARVREMHMRVRGVCQPNTFS